MTDGPLDGVRVLDLSRALSGPYAARMLADLGADVVKVEPPGGDESRRIAPHHDRDMSALITFANVGKRGLCIDLRQTGAAEVVLDLAEAADVLIENFRPGVMERLGLGWEALHERNPRLVALSVNGFGSDSSAAGRRAYAPVVHGETGLVESQATAWGTEVVPFREHWGDTVASLHGALAILAALRVAEHTGQGQRVEVPMFDALLSTCSEALNLLLPEPDDRVMNPILDAGPHGKIATTGAVQHVWAAMARVSPELSDPAPPGADRATRARTRFAALESWAAAQESREAVLARLDEAGIGAGPVLPMTEALTGALATERELLVLVDDRRGGTRPVVRPPARFSASRNAIAGPAPRLGEHGRAVLSEWVGYDTSRIDSLEKGGVLLQPECS
jgi:crotonobetainyl-CoA:carnitine CoA-transferase CaiB-like acyl-CoA transferase